MSDPIIVAYKDVPIVYDEPFNVWAFTVGGGERFAQSLGKAKRAIDRSLGAKADFEPFQVWYADGTGFQLVKVDSITHPGEYENNMERFWIVKANGERRRTLRNCLYLANPENTATIGEIEALRERMFVLVMEEETLREKLVRVPKPRPIPEDAP